jgi:hypothetical protein
MVQTPANTVGFHHVSESPSSELCTALAPDGHTTGAGEETHPQIGVPVNAAMAMIAHARPIRTPISPTCELGAHDQHSTVHIIREGSSYLRDAKQPGRMLTYAPLKKPNRRENTMIPASPCAGSQPNMTMPEHSEAMMSMLNTPSLSAIKFGSVRPNTEAALMIESE